MLRGPAPDAEGGGEGLTDDEGPRDMGVGQGMCIECGELPATHACDQCRDDFCFVCYKAQHRRGGRAKHTYQEHAPAVAVSPAKQREVEIGLAEAPIQGGTSAAAAAAAAASTTTAVSVGDWFTERSKYIPLRLTMEERKILRLLEGALSCSSYTDKIDVPNLLKNKARRTHAQLSELCAMLVGLLVAIDYEKGQQLAQDHEFAQYEPLFQRIFEIGRRHKIMNPEKMRAEYGKLVYMLQDSMVPEVRELLGFSCVKPIRTVYTLLEEKGALAILMDDKMVTATSEILDDGIKTREMIRREIKAKEAAVEYLARKYQATNLSADTIKRCIYSICDNNSFLTFNRDPVDKMITHMHRFFKSDLVEEGFSLSITGGVGGARLTHNHERQFHFVLQSLTLWRDILNDMFKLWCLAETDLLQQGNTYTLKDTGQGLHRVQPAPNISRAMRVILHRQQDKAGTWVGSSVVHLGDSNVPNALMFIDKYTQVSRILNPIVITMKQIDIMYNNATLRKYIDTFGGTERTKKLILHDLFRYAFDGSGADNFFDAGSCIDGRLTSAWNWCSMLEQKAFFPIFKLAGFLGFDGDFQT